MEYQKSYKVNY